MAEFSDFTIAASSAYRALPSSDERTRRRYSHVLLDEYQDTSTTQAALLAALFHVDASRRSAVNAVGDPFQSIYAWRGASLVHSVCSSKISTCLPDTSHSRCPSPGATAV